MIFFFFKWRAAQFLYLIFFVLIFVGRGFMHLNFAGNVKTSCPERPTSLFSHVLADEEALGFAIGIGKDTEIYTKIDIGII